MVNAVVCLQRRWRVKREKKFALGRGIAKKHQMQQQVFSRLEKYRGYTSWEAELVHRSTMFEREKGMLEEFFEGQINAYMKELDQMAQQIEMKTEREFNAADWSFNSTGREWTSRTGILKI